MQRALDQIPLKFAPRQRSIAVATNVAQRVESPVYVGQDQAFAIDRDPPHLAWCKLGSAGDENEPIGHNEPPPPDPFPAVRGKGQASTSVWPEPEQFRGVVRGDLAAVNLGNTGEDPTQEVL